MSSFIWRNRPTEIYATVAGAHKSDEEKEFGAHQKTQSIAYGYELFVFYRLWDGNLFLMHLALAVRQTKKVNPTPVWQRVVITVSWNSCSV